MLSKLRVQHYKSLFDTEIDLEPLTVFIGPNGSGKSNICEALLVLSDFLQQLTETSHLTSCIEVFKKSLGKTSKNLRDIKSKFWQGIGDYILFDARSNIIIDSKSIKKDGIISNIKIRMDFSSQEVQILDENNENIENYALIISDYNPDDAVRRYLRKIDYPKSSIGDSLAKVKVYDFAPFSLCEDMNDSSEINKTGEGITYSLVDILHANRSGFDELEQRLTTLVPNIKKIVLQRGADRRFSLQLVDRYSEHRIAASDISDGTLRILGFLTALYQENTPSIICFEEIENGVHPWLLHKMMELLKIVSTEGITGKPVQVLITTHSPLLLNYVEPHQVRAVELDPEGKTQVHKLPTDSVRFQKALEAYDGALGELWFTNVFGGNPV